VQKADTLSKALGNRPTIKVQMQGRAGPVADRLALLQAAFDNKLKAEKLKELAGKVKRCRIRRPSKFCRRNMPVTSRSVCGRSVPAPTGHTEEAFGPRDGEPAEGEHAGQR